ncbi:MAG: epoxyqueuosine reductase QueH [Candidatus Berkelbacteria bacterium]|nr:epoxyqueuosine reductase QueH [Candidatus Berkelbacteria bacterium]
MKKILLHTCCVSCLSYVHNKLAERDFSPIIFYYNPSIQGKIEYLNRLKDVDDYCQKNGLEVIIPEYNEEEFFKPIKLWQDPKSLKFINDKNRFRRKRCEFCYQLKMFRTAEQAKKKRIKYFSTTLLTSPYQDHEFIDYIASQIAKEKNLEFVYDDFRKGYWQGRNYSRSHKFMIPSYCGCTFSINERMLE